MKKSCFLLSVFLALPVSANICPDHFKYSMTDGEDGFVEVTAQKTDKSSLIREMSMTADASYNDRNLVALKSQPIRKQEGNSSREALALIKETTIPFSTNSKYGNTQAGLLTHEKDKAGKSIITIAFHGTECYKDLITDANALKRNANIIGLKGYAHGGFLNRYLESRESLHGIINDRLNEPDLKVSDVEFRVTGHSLGGALATLCAADLKIKLDNAQVDLVTFSSPRVLDSAGAEMLNNMLDTNIRIWRANDPISTVSLGTTLGLGYFTGFKHTGMSVKLSAKESGISMKNHSHELHIKDAHSAGNVPILPHVGWKDSLAATASRIGAFFNPWSSKK